jgi:hypothetical protein
MRQDIAGCWRLERCKLVINELADEFLLKELMRPTSAYPLHGWNLRDWELVSEHPLELRLKHPPARLYGEIPVSV